MKLAELWRYPVKSMAGEKLNAAGLDPLGIPGDRERVVVDGAGRILSSRARPRLLGMHATLDANGRARVDGHDWEAAEVAARVRAAGGPGARLVPMAGPGRFDIMPLLVTTDGAIAALGIDPRRLRPNLVVGDVAGLAEREWEGSFLAIGDAVIGLHSLRGRCIMTTFDPDTGAQDLDVLKRIQREYDGTFALNAWVARPGRIAVGDPVEWLEVYPDAAPPPLGRYVRPRGDA